MNQNILVSFVVPVYNVYDYVGKCLEDVCSQTYHNIEIIVIDDGSTDGSGEICDRYAECDERIYVIHQSNQGLSAARNIGIDMAKGKYIYFMDSDDRIHHKVIEKLVGIAIREECQIVQTSVFSFVDDSLLPAELTEEKLSYYDNREACIGMFKGVIPEAGVVQNKLYDRELFCSGLRFPIGRQHEDDALVYRLFWEARRIAVTNQKLFYYRSKRPGSIMHVPYSIKRLDALVARKERYEFFQAIGDVELFGLALISWCEAAIYSMMLLKQSNIEQKELYISKIRKELETAAKKLVKLPGVSNKVKLRIYIYMIFPQLYRMMNR